MNNHPMSSKRIVHCANFNFIKHNGCFLHNTANKISNGLIRNGHSVLNFPDRDIKRCYSCFGYLKQIGSSKFNQTFYDYCIKAQPDGLIFGHADTIWPETVAKIKEALPSIKILQWNVDCIDKNFVSNNIANIKSKLDVVDYTLITTADKNLLNQFNSSTVFYMPNIVDSSIENGKAFAIRHPRYDLVFTARKKSVREFCGKQYPAIDVVNKISQNIDVSKSIFPGTLDAPVCGGEYQNIISNSAMGLCLSQVSHNYLYSSDRMAHLMGNGVLIFLDRRTGFDKYFTDDEIIFYTEEDELYKKIKFYSQNIDERMRIAKNGYLKYHNMFNEKIVTKHIIDLMFSEKGAKKYPWL